MLWILDGFLATGTTYVRAMLLVNKDRPVSQKRRFPTVPKRLIGWAVITVSPRVISDSALSWVTAVWKEEYLLRLGVPVAICLAVLGQGPCSIDVGQTQGRKSAPPKPGSESPPIGCSGDEGLH